MSTEENCTYFRHFTPGQDAEIFEYKTQKGEFLHQLSHIVVIMMCREELYPPGRSGVCWVVFEGGGPESFAM